MIEKGKQTLFFLLCLFGCNYPQIKNPLVSDKAALENKILPEYKLFEIPTEPGHSYTLKVGV